MPLRAALNHRTHYRYDRFVTLSPQVVRLRPAPHCRTPILSYSLKVEPPEHFVNWQQDPQGNFLARFVFPQPVNQLLIEVDLVAELTVINPFDFFLEPAAERFPFKYDPWLSRDLRPFLQCEPAGPLLREFLQTIPLQGQNTVAFLVDLNRKVQARVQYVIRLEPGVQSPEETLAKGSGSCRDSAWLLTQLLRHLGLAARFVSGYLIQLSADIPPLEGPPGPAEDFTDLHAWTEVYIPGAGWVGLDPTSGLFAGEGHLPLACTPDPGSAAPITGEVSPCQVDFNFTMRVSRIEEDPRVTKPYSENEWQAIHACGELVDLELARHDVRLTMGGEPTFVSIDDMQGAEWNTEAVGEHKRRLSERLVRRLQARFAPGGLLHFGQGKWYPGESLPRWALTCLWRTDGLPLWKNSQLIADENDPDHHGPDDARRFLWALARNLGVTTDFIQPAYEDQGYYLWKEQRLPLNVSPDDPRLRDPEERARLAQVFQRGLDTPVGYVIPLRRQWAQGRSPWETGPWPFRGSSLLLLPGDSPIGLRLPLDSLPWVEDSRIEPLYPPDPLEPRRPLPPPRESPPTWRSEQPVGHRQQIQEQTAPAPEAPRSTSIRTALCVEARRGRLHVFLPPVARLEDYVELVETVEQTTQELDLRIVIEGYLPPPDPRLRVIKVTPDPGVIEVNTQPSTTWRELVQNTEALYEEARQARLGTEKFDLDGRHTGTGGGNHVVLGGRTPADSPFLRRPDLLRSMIAYWLNHPSLSYLFSGRFVGPTSQAPRVDEGRRDALYELRLAFDLVPEPGEQAPPWLVDRLFRNLLVDVTGNTHRAEFCIDKLYAPHSTSGRQGLVEFRAFEMPPHARMSLTQQLLIRALVAWFWKTPYRQAVIDWGTALHDRFLMPHFVWQDFEHVIRDLCQAGFPLSLEWFRPHFEFRFPHIGHVTYEGLTLELRSAIEPWYVLGEEPAAGGTVRHVDSSVERLQVRLRGGAGNRYLVCCNRRRVPLTETGIAGELVGAVRYRAWQPPHCLHPTIPVHTPLVFDLVDTWNGRAVTGCTYHVAHPAGRNYETFPVNSLEAEARRAARFQAFGHTPGPLPIPPEETNPVFPLTLDLRRQPPPHPLVIA